MSDDQNISKKGRKPVQFTDEDIAVIKRDYENGMITGEIHEARFPTHSLSTVHRKITELRGEGILSDEIHKKARQDMKEIQRRFHKEGIERFKTVGSIGSGHNGIFSNPNLKLGAERIGTKSVFAQMIENVNALPSANHRLSEQNRVPYSPRSQTYYDFERVREYVPNVSTLLPKEIRASLQSIEHRGRTQRPEELMKKIRLTLLLDMAYNQTRLEHGEDQVRKGDTQLVFASLVNGSSRPASIDLVRYLELKNHLSAAQLLVDQCRMYPDALPADSVRGLHSALMQDLGNSPEEEHNERSSDQHIIQIGSSVYTPLSAQYLRSIGNSKPLDVVLRSELNSIISKANQISDPIEASFFLNLNIAYLQPFCDGNKRLARLAGNYPLISKGHVPLTWQGVFRDDYINGMVEYYETGNTDPIAELFAHSYQESVASYTKYVNASQFSEDKIMLVSFREFRRAVKSFVMENQCTVLAAFEELVPHFYEQLKDLKEIDAYTLAEEINKDISTQTGPTNARDKIPLSVAESFEDAQIRRGSKFWVSDDAGEQLHNMIKYYEPQESMRMR